MDKHQAFGYAHTRHDNAGCGTPEYIGPGRPVGHCYAERNIRQLAPRRRRGCDRRVYNERL